MSREQLSQKIHWPSIIWVLGILNVGTMLPQLWKLIATHNTEGLSLLMFCLALFMQAAFAVEGFFTRNRMLMVCMGLSALVTAAIVGMLLYLGT